MSILVFSLEESAQQVLALAERARLKIATNGEIPADWMARQYGVTRGEGLSMIVAASRLLSKKPDVRCPTCNGSGRVPA